MIFLKIAITAGALALMTYFPLKIGIFHDEEDPEKNWKIESIFAIVFAFLCIITIITFFIGVWLF